MEGRGGWGRVIEGRGDGEQWRGKGSDVFEPTFLAMCSRSSGITPSAAAEGARLRWMAGETTTIR
jgi:hypothetical protein